MKRAYIHNTLAARSLPGFDVLKSGDLSVPNLFTRNHGAQKLQNISAPRLALDHFESPEKNFEGSETKRSSGLDKRFHFSSLTPWQAAEVIGRVNYFLSEAQLENSKLVGTPWVVEPIPDFADTCKPRYWKNSMSFGAFQAYSKEGNWIQTAFHPTLERLSLVVGNKERSTEMSVVPNVGVDIEDAIRKGMTCTYRHSFVMSFSQIKTFLGEEGFWLGAQIMNTVSLEEQMQLLMTSVVKKVAWLQYGGLSLPHATIESSNVEIKSDDTYMIGKMKVKHLDVPPETDPYNSLVEADLNKNVDKLEDIRMTVFLYRIFGLDQFMSLDDRLMTSIGRIN